MQKRPMDALIWLIAAGAFIAACFAFTGRAIADGFTDVTESSGIAALVDAGYKQSPDWWLSGVDLIDLDGAGKLDVFLSVHAHGTPVMALNDGKGHFTIVNPATSGTLPPSEDHICYDINEDGLVDMQTTFRDGGGQWWLNQSTPGHLDFKPTNMDLGGSQARQSAMIDIDRDGLVDWMHEAPGTTFSKGDGKGHFIDTKKPLFNTGWKDGTSMIPVDLNGDGYIDLIMSMRGYEEEKIGRSRIYLNDGKGNFTDATAACGLSEAGLQIMGVGDFNKHGALDLICLENGRDVTVYLNDGKAHFTKVPNAITGMQGATRPTYANWGMAVAVDLDNDGIPDVLMNGREFLYVLRGTGGGHFTYMNKAWGIIDHSDCAVDAGICFGDIDGNGVMDILGFTTDPSGKKELVKVYRNDLPRQNWLKVRPIGLPGNRGAAGAKIRLYSPGALGDNSKLLAYEQVAIWSRQVCHSYYSYAETERHFGLGAETSADVSVEFYPSGKIVQLKDAKANQTVRISEDNNPAAP